MFTIRRLLSMPAVHNTRIAVCQLRATGDVARNLDRARHVVTRAAAKGAGACFLPEASDFIVPTQDACYSLSHPLRTHTYTLGLQALARELGVWIGVGVHELPEPQRDGERVVNEAEQGRKVFNSLVVIAPTGEVREAYRKVHLFDIALPTTATEPATKTGESLRVLAGSRINPPLQLNPSLGPIGLEICYDLRFPEMHRRLVDAGAKVLLFPAAFTVVTGRDHWYTLLRATAIQYQVYVLAPAQIGEHYPSSSSSPPRISWGESLAFDLWGRELGRLPSVDDTDAHEGEDTFFTVDLDMSLVDAVRAQIPLGLQMRHDVYRDV